MSQTVRLTYGDLLVAVAEEFGVAQIADNGSLDVPSDSTDMWRCARAIDRAIRRISSQRRWRWLTKRFELSVKADGSTGIGRDPSLYQMPDDFNGAAIGDWIDEEHGNRIKILDRFAYDREKGANSPVSGVCPIISTLKNAEQDHGTESNRKGWRAEFFPAPANDMTLKLSYSSYPFALKDKASVFMGGPEFDILIEAAARLEARLDVTMQGASPSALAEREADWDKALASAKKMDSTSKSPLIGYLPDVSGRRDVLADEVAPRISSMVVNGIVIF